MSYLVSFVLVFFSPFSIAITSLGKERANLTAFRTFFDLCLLDLSVSSSSWCLGRAAVCDCGTPWTFLLPFCFRNLTHGRDTGLQLISQCEITALLALTGDTNPLIFFLSDQK